MKKQTVLILACVAVVGCWSAFAQAAPLDNPSSGPAAADDAANVPMDDTAADTGKATPEKVRQIELPLEKKAKVVEKRLYPKAMKHELSVYFGIDPMDSYVFGIVEGGRYVFHPVEYLGIQVHGGAVQTFENSDAKYIKKNEYANAKNFESAQMKWLAGGDLIFYPVYGKFVLLGDVVLHYDAGINIGAAAVGHKGGDVYGAPDIGLLSNLYLTKYLSLRGDLTYYAVIAKDKRIATGSSSSGTASNSNMLRSHLMLTVGLSFHLPVD